MFFSYVLLATSTRSCSRVKIIIAQIHTYKYKNVQAQIIVQIYSSSHPAFRHFNKVKLQIIITQNQIQVQKDKQKYKYISHAAYWHLNMDNDMLKLITTETQIQIQSVKKIKVKHSFDLNFIFQLYLATLNSLVSLQVGVLNPIASTAIKICIGCH